MKKFLIVLLCIFCILGLSGLSVWLINRSISTEEEILDDSSIFDDGFTGSTSTQEDDKEDDGNSSSDLPSEDNPSESNVYFTLPDKFTSGDYLLDLNERVQVVPYCYPDYTYFTDYIVWTSSNPGVVSIQPLEDLVSSCYLIGESEGYSTITATYEDQSISFEVGVSVLFGVVNEYVYYDPLVYGASFGSVQVFVGDSYCFIPRVCFYAPYLDSDLISSFDLFFIDPFGVNNYLSYEFFLNDGSGISGFIFNIYFEYSALCRNLGVTDVYPSFTIPFDFVYERVLADDPFTHYVLDYSFSLKFDYDGTVTILDSTSPLFSGGVLGELNNHIYSNYGGIG